LINFPIVQAEVPDEGITDNGDQNKEDAGSRVVSHQFKYLACVGSPAVDIEAAIVYSKQVMLS
jgi:hypothetical protein